MLGSSWSRVTAGIAVLVGIAGLSYELAGAAQALRGPAAVVEFTADGKLKRPVGYRNWVYIGTPLTPKVGSEIRTDVATLVSGIAADERGRDFVYRPRGRGGS